MWNEPAKEDLEKIPLLYETEHIPAKEKLIYMHFFYGGSDWYVAEFDGNDLFFGFVVLNNDLLNAEWGYFTLSELKQIECFDRDLHWKVVPAMKVDKIRRAYLFKGVML